MAEFCINVTEEERRTVALAIEKLNQLQHLSYMSRAMLAETSGIKSTKVRVILQDMIDSGEIEQYAVTQNRSIQRYYYVLTDAGKALLQEEADTDEGV